MSNVQGLDGEIEPGEIAFTYPVVEYDQAPTLFDFRATWEGGRTITWWQDISDHQPGLSPGSSAPSEGWASWRNGSDLLVAYTWRDVEKDGWAFVRGAAPGIGEDDDVDMLWQPDTWVELAKTILGVVHKTLPEVESGSYD